MRNIGDVVKHKVVIYTPKFCPACKQKEIGFDKVERVISSEIYAIHSYRTLNDIKVWYSVISLEEDYVQTFDLHEEDIINEN